MPTTTNPHAPNTEVTKCEHCGEVLIATFDLSTDDEWEAVERGECDECHRYFAEPSIGMHDTWAEWNGER